MCGRGDPCAVIVSEKVAQYITTVAARKRYFGGAAKASRDR